MKTRVPLLAVAALALAGGACTQIQAKSAFQDGNKLYKEENYKRAIEKYQRAVDLDPGMAEAWFYLGSSHQALYRPGKDAPENLERLQKAVDFYKKSLEVNTSGTEPQKRVKENTLGALTAIYSEDPHKSFDEALRYAQELVQSNPTEAKNLFAMANLYEKFDKVPDAEQQYKKAFELNSQDVKACGALAAFYNKPLWEGRSRFDEAIDILTKCADLAPEDPTGYYKLATFYWDKAYRDPLLDDEAKGKYADRGLEQVDRALGMKPDYIDAIIYKGLLYRVKALVTKNLRLRQQYLEQAQTLQKQALELKKEQAAGGAAPAS
ncbi:MAG: tetratricopeptide repeat protein [Acidobacteria bacterium]|nr:tetratricopeptide repeat protein [Acidobacteriota bacterium]